MIRSGCRICGVVPVVLLLVIILHMFLQWGTSLTLGSFTKGKWPKPLDVELVVASLQREDTLWVHRFIPDWRTAVYVVDDPSAAYTVPQNKGREAMVYLTHIIENYDSLSSITVFVHAARFAWHNDDPDYDTVRTLHNLNLSYVIESGYVNLRCVWTLGCPTEIRPHADFLDEQGRNEEIAQGRKIMTKHVYKEALQTLMPGMMVPHLVAVSCCSQFAVSRETIQTHPREDYVRWRKWLLETPLDDDITGRIFEYLWHIIFGKDAVFCPPAGECYCKVYGLCDLKCSSFECEGRYVLPKVANLPVGWPKIGWDGEERNFTGPL